MPRTDPAPHTERATPRRPRAAHAATVAPRREAWRRLEAARQGCVTSAPQGVTGSPSSTWSSTALAVAPTSR